MGKYIHKFVIDRKTWANGKHNSEETALLNTSNNCQCCLGFYAESCGISRAKIADVGMLDDAKDNYKRPRDFERKLTRSVILNESEAVALNDGTYCKDDVREKRIAAWFAHHDIKVTFRGKYPTEE